jgi:hypothetical protein
MPERDSTPAGPTTGADIEPLPAAVAADLARTWERILADMYPGTSWTLAFDPDPNHAAARLARRTAGPEDPAASDAA